MSILMETPAPTVSLTYEFGLADLLLRAATEHRTTGVRVVHTERPDNSEFLSYPALLEQVRCIQSGLKAHAGAPGSKIVLLLEHPRDFIPAFWACILGGYVPCPLAPIRNDAERWAKHLAHVQELLDQPLFVTDGELPASFSSVSLNDLRAGSLQGTVHRAELPNAAILMLTSGSTGNSKAVELTHGNLLASLAGRAGRQQLSCNDVTFNWIAFDHVAALLESHMIALYVGATQVHAEPAAVLSDPLQFLRLIQRYRVSVAFAPNFLLGQLNDAVRSWRPAGEEALTLAIDLGSLRRIVTGGEANVVETGLHFLGLLAPYGLRPNALWPAFGMTETCAACVYSHEFPLIDAGREFAAVGTPIEGLEMRIADERGAILPTGESGELQLRGPMIFSRYYHNEAATLAAFTEDGWFRTGDIGRIVEGRLSLVARNKDSIIVSGVNYYGHELESKLEQLEGVQRSFVAAFPTRPRGADTEQLVVAFASTFGLNEEEALHQLVVAVRNTTIMLWGFRPALILPLPPSAFPKTSLGKIQRSLLRKRLEAGDLDSHVRWIAEVTERQIGPFTAPASLVEEAIAKEFAAVLRVDLNAVSTLVSFFDLGGTSLDILKLARALQRFGLDATIPIVLQNPTVRQLAARIATGDQAKRREYSPIVLLQATGKRIPLFCVHPGNGEIFVLVNLAKYFLRDRPFYALRPRGFDEGEERFTSVEEIVSTYVDAIVRCQPHGPYAIAGYSLGALIAFEIARKLEALGEQVKFLASMDGRPLQTSMPLPFNLAVGLALVTDLITKEQSLELQKVFGPRLPTREECECILRCASPERMMELNLDLEKFAVWSRVAHSIESLLFSHRRSGTVKSMTIFCSEGISSRYATVEWTRQTWREQELQHWDDFVMRPRYVDVPGHHHTLMGPKHVAAFQAILRAEINLALGD